jgi:hypothetical protein
LGLNEDKYIKFIVEFRKAVVHVFECKHDEIAEFRVRSCGILTTFVFILPNFDDMGISSRLMSESKRAYLEMYDVFLDFLKSKLNRCNFKYDQELDYSLVEILNNSIQVRAFNANNSICCLLELELFIFNL